MRSRAYLTLWIVFLLLSFGIKGQVTLDPCIENSDFTIVILGSSTAAGAGPSHPDSTWVNKYRKRLQEINSANQVINLAVGGYTTYKIMPDEFVTPSNRPSVDSLHNISHALTYDPNAIIVNLPSNDRQWPREEQLANFDSLFNFGLHHDVPVYICTTQPIVPNSFAQYQKDVADSVLLRFGASSIDFFYPLSDTDHTVLPVYAADAVHLNDSGHQVLYSQVRDHDILAHVYRQPSHIDLALTGIINEHGECSDPNSLIGISFASLGDTVLSGTSIDLNVNGLTYSLPLNGYALSMYRRHISSLCGPIHGYHPLFASTCDTSRRYHSR